MHILQMVSSKAEEKLQFHTLILLGYDIAKTKQDWVVGLVPGFHLLEYMDK